MTSAILGPGLDPCSRTEVAVNTPVFFLTAVHSRTPMPRAAFLPAATLSARVSTLLSATQHSPQWRRWTSSPGWHFFVSVRLQEGRNRKNCRRRSSIVFMLNDTTKRTFVNNVTVNWKNRKEQRVRGGDRLDRRRDSEKD